MNALGRATIEGMLRWDWARALWAGGVCCVLASACGHGNDPGRPPAQGGAPGKGTAGTSSEAKGGRSGSAGTGGKAHGGSADEAGQGGELASGGAGRGGSGGHGGEARAGGPPGTSGS